MQRIEISTEIYTHTLQNRLSTNGTISTARISGLDFLQSWMASSKKVGYVEVAIAVGWHISQLILPLHRGSHLCDGQHLLSWRCACCAVVVIARWRAWHTGGLRTLWKWTSKQCFAASRVVNQRSYWSFVYLNRYRFYSLIFCLYTILSSILYTFLSYSLNILLFFSFLFSLYFYSFSNLVLLWCNGCFGCRAAQYRTLLMAAVLWQRRQS